MAKLLCQALNCDTPASTHFLRARERTCVEESHFCKNHGRITIADYYSQGRTAVADMTFPSEEAILFDIGALYCEDAPEGPWQIYLKQMNGICRLGINTGPFEWGVLLRELQHRPMPRPLTHRAMASAISALGGRLQYAVIDKFFPAEQMYEAKLHIQQMDAALVVDVRPSDAIVLALICDVPIIVLNQVLASLARMQE